MYPDRLIGRRDFLYGLGATLGTVAFNAMLQAEERSTAAAAGAAPLEPKRPHPIIATRIGVAASSRAISRSRIMLTPLVRHSRPVCSNLCVMRQGTADYGPPLR